MFGFQEVTTDELISHTGIAAAVRPAPDEHECSGRLRLEDPEFRLRFARLVTRYWR